MIGRFVIVFDANCLVILCTRWVGASMECELSKECQLKADSEQTYIAPIQQPYFRGFVIIRSRQMEKC